MRHPDPHAVDIEELVLAHARIVEDVVVAARDEHRRELLAPVDHGLHRDVSAVQDQVHAAQRIADLRPELVEREEQLRKVGVGDQTDLHDRRLGAPAEAGNQPPTRARER